MACSPTKKLETAVKKVGVRESINYLTEKYPEYFSVKYQDVIVYKTDTVFIQPKDGTIVSTIIHDTIYFKDKNVDIKVNKNTGKGHYKLPADTVFKHDTIRVPVKVKCPETFLYTDKIKSLELKHLKYKNKTTWTIVILSFLLSLAIVYFFFKILK